MDEDIDQVQKETKAVKDELTKTKDELEQMKAKEQDEKWEGEPDGIPGLI